MRTAGEGGSVTTEVPFDPVCYKMSRRSARPSSVSLESGPVFLSNPVPLLQLHSSTYTGGLPNISCLGGADD